ncbi:response regulator [Candidatus Woesearchaeota archaeon]|nr:response regulator [Candidatus Woesearchaeota archaeon]
MLKKKRAEQKKMIIIADDEPNILELLRMIFDKDYSLKLVATGKGVLDAVKRERPDLILLDVMMPELNGYEVCEILKNDPRTKDIIVAMLSAKGQERDIIQGLKLGADHYITKPFDPTELKKMVHEMLK